MLRNDLVFKELTILRLQELYEKIGSRQKRKKLKA